MGGNALKTLKGKGRMSPEEYRRVQEEVLKHLGMWYKRVQVPPEAFDKLDYGDVDVVCLAHDFNDIPMDPVKQLGSTEVVRNAHLTSFEFLGRQIDLTHVRTEQALDFKLVFNSYGMVGSILAVMCKPVGLLINHERLAVRLPHLSQNLCLTCDIWQALQFLGLSGDIWKQGFSDRASLCHWFAASPFFNLKDFKMHPKAIVDNQMMQELDQDAKLGCLPPTAMPYNETDKDKGLGQIVDNPLAINDGVHSMNPIFDMRTCCPSQDDVLADALGFFNKEHEYQALLSMHDQCQQVKLKFNGELVMQWTGCYKKDLGRLLRAFKERFTPSDILSMDEDIIKQELLSLIQTLSAPP